MFPHKTQTKERQPCHLTNNESLNAPLIIQDNILVYFLTDRILNLYNVSINKLY